VICPNMRDRHCSGAGVTEGDGHGHWRTTVRCYYCRRTLPLGPAMDDYEMFETETNLAEFLAIHRDEFEPGPELDETDDACVELFAICDPIVDPRMLAAAAVTANRQRPWRRP